jgi:hypothetical protein
MARILLTIVLITALLCLFASAHAKELDVQLEKVQTDAVTPQAEGEAPSQAVGAKQNVWRPPKGDVPDHENPYFQLHRRLKKQLHPKEFGVPDPMDGPATAPPTAPKIEEQGNTEKTEL